VQKAFGIIASVRLPTFWWYEILGRIVIMEYILCLGDSLTFGARDEFHRSYPAELSRLYWERQQKEVYCLNYGINGETSSQLQRRAYQNCRSCTQARVALILIGTNDTFLPQDLKIYEDNLRQIVALAKLDRPHVGIGLLPPIIGPGLPNYALNAQQQIDSFNTVVEKVARDHRCFTADFRGLGKEIIDTVHFGHAGYTNMAEIWYDAIEAHVGLFRS
jgi:lysophospholipase L1-like esterase